MAPASLVSPLGAITVISNAVLSRAMLKEPIPKQKAIGVVLALAGAVLIAVNAPSPLPIKGGEGVEVLEEEVIFQSLMTWRACGYVLGVAVVAFCASNPLKLSFLISDKFREDKVVVNCVLCGCAGTMTVTSAKAVFNSLSQAFAGNPAMFTRGDICWLTYITIIVAVGSIVGQVKYLNEALLRHGTSRVVPVYYITFTVITMSAGMVLFLEISFEPLVRTVVLFVLGLLLAFSGVYLINNLAPEEGEGSRQLAVPDQFTSRSRAVICSTWEDDVESAESACSSGGTVDVEMLPPYGSGSTNLSLELDGNNGDDSICVCHSPICPVPSRAGSTMASPPKTCEDIVQGYC